VSHGQNVTVDVLIGLKCHSGRSELGRNVQAATHTKYPEDAECGVDREVLSHEEAVCGPAPL
jgi:hypothetical protein